MKIFHFAICLLVVAALGHRHGAIDALKKPASKGRTVAYPATYTLGSLHMVKCMQDNVYGLDGLYCVNITRPVNPWGPTTGPMFTAGYVARIGSSQLNKHSSKHKVVIAPTGGPGDSKYDIAQYVTLIGQVYDPSYFTDVDFVTMDDRGIGISCRLGCDNTIDSLVTLAYSGTDPSAYGTLTAAFRDNCINEILTDTRPEHNTPCFTHSTLDPRAQRVQFLPFMGDKYVASDFKAFHAASGYPKAVIFGISGGAAATQIIGGAYPEMAAGLVLDSGMDLITDQATKSRAAQEVLQTELARLAELCSLDPACAADACPGTDNQPDCAQVASDAMWSALSLDIPWPKLVDYNYLNFDTLETTLLPATPVHRSYEASLGSMFDFWSRSELARELIRASRGDHYQMARRVYGMVNMDPRDPLHTVHDLYLLSPNSLLFPFVEGMNTMFRWRTTPIGPLDASKRAVQFIQALGQASVSDVFGEYSITWEDLFPAFSDPNTPVYSVNYQNHTLTPVTGWHPKMPIMIGASTLDGRLPDSHSKAMYRMYAGTGRTSLFIFDDGSHAVSSLGVLYGNLDYGYLPWVASLNGAILHNVWPSGVAEFPTVTPFPKYYPIVPASFPFEQLGMWTENEVVSLPEWVAYETVVTGCKSGFLYWGQYYSATQEMLTLVNCTLSDGYAVSGVFLYDWSTPIIAINGASLESLGAMTVEDSTGPTPVIRCFTYQHPSGVSPVQTEIVCPPASRSKPMTLADHRAKVADIVAKISVA